jgi:hypothetical protein
MRIRAVNGTTAVHVATEPDTAPPELVALRVLTPRVSPGAVARINITHRDALAGTAHIVVIVTHPALPHDIVDGATPARLSVFFFFFFFFFVFFFLVMATRAHTRT